MMITRLALYHRWRRLQVTSLAYPIFLTSLTMGGTVVIFWLSLRP